MQINPDCRCVAIDDLVTRASIGKFNFARYDYVIDSIDHVQHKVSLYIIVDATRSALSQPGAPAA